MVGNLHSRHHRPHIPGRLEGGHHSLVHCALDTGGWRRPPLALPAPCGRTGARNSGPLMGGEGKAWSCMSLQVYSDSLDIWHLRSGAPLLGSAHSPDTWTHGPRPGTRGTHRPCEIKKKVPEKCLHAVPIQASSRLKKQGLAGGVSPAASAKRGTGQRLGPLPGRSCLVPTLLFVCWNFTHTFHTRDVGFAGSSFY